jgi:hypothetical protein
MAKKELEYTLTLSPNYTHAADIKKTLSQAPQSN